MTALQRYIPENGEMTYELAGIPSQLSLCFSTYISFNRYSSLVPLVDFRTSYNQGEYMELLYGKPEMLRLLYHSDFKFNGTMARNIRLKVWDFTKY